MKKNIVIAIACISMLTFAACKKEKSAPTPDEQELITTVKITLSDDAGFNQTFEYKVENGFSSGTSAIEIDTVKLNANKTYSAVLTVLNEKASPVEDITAEIIEKSYEHLFVFASAPASGNGSVSVADGNKDSNGKPLNQTFQLTTSTAGKGTFRVTLMHQPTDKNGTTPETAGGETDLDATFPVSLQ
ncbi:MAG: hypothetical protein QM743_09865 [Chitinophagaceae bacterium]